MVDFRADAGILRQIGALIEESRYSKYCLVLAVGIFIDCCRPVALVFLVPTNSKDLIADINAIEMSRTITFTPTLSPTVTLTLTLTHTATITFTPTQTLPPRLTYTPMITRKLTIIPTPTLPASTESCIPDDMKWDLG